jgi:hypothetical protein
MGDHELDRESELDAGAEQALAALLTAPALTDHEWDALRTGVERACELPLARRRAAARARRLRVVKWLGPALPLAAAAVLLLLLGVPSGGRNGDGQENDALSAAERALLADVSDAEFTLLVSGAAEAEALLLIAAGED